MTASEPLTITRAVREGCTLLVVAGDLDLATHGRLNAEFVPAIDAELPLIVDLTRVPFMDSSGLHTLVRARAVATTRDVPMALVPSPAVARVLQLTEADRAFTVRPTVAEALAAVRQRTA